jgi:hypothetical protein
MRQKEEQAVLDIQGNNWPHRKIKHSAEILEIKKIPLRMLQNLLKG